jgi:two-component system, cell cycle response regulator DivK
VLVADDNERLLDLFRIGLSRVPGVCVVTAQDGAEAVSLARQLRPDVILMDLSMPVMDGLEAARHLKADRATLRIPVVAVTGSTVEPGRVRAAGFDGILTKPLGPEAILGEIVRVLTP